MVVNKAPVGPWIVVWAKTLQTGKAKIPIQSKYSNEN